MGECGRGDGVYRVAIGEGLGTDRGSAADSEEKDVLLAHIDREGLTAEEGQDLAVGEHGRAAAEPLARVIRPEADAGGRRGYVVQILREPLPAQFGMGEGAGEDGAGSVWIHR